MKSHSKLPCLVLFVLLLYSMKLFEINTTILIDSADITSGDFASVEENVSAGRINQIMIPLLLAISVLILLADRTARSLLVKRPALPLFIAITALLLMATIAVSEHTSITIARVGSQILFLTCIAALAYSIHDKRNLYLTAGLAFLTALAVDLALYFTLNTGFSGDGLFVSYHRNKNMAGNQYGVATMVFIFLAITRKNPLFLIACAISATLVLFSESKTTMGAIGIFLALSLLYRFPIARVAVIFGTLIVAVSASVYFSLGNNPPESFTGRGEIWNFLSSHVWNKPLLGHGFSSFWDVGPQSINVVERIDFIASVNTGHNGYIDLMVGTGLVGLAVVVSFLFAAALLIVQLDSRFFIVHYLFIAFLIANVTESYIFYYQNIMWLMLILMIAAAYTDKSAKKPARRRARLRSRSHEKSGFV